MEDAAEQLRDEQEASKVAKAIDMISIDILKHGAKYPKTLQDLPRLATAMEKAIKRGNLDDARVRANQLEPHVESYAPSDEPAQEAKFTLRQRLRQLTKIE